MAVTSDTLKIVIKLQDAASRGIRGIGRTLGSIQNRVKTTTRGFFGLQTAIAGLVTTATAGLLARSFINAADAAEGYRVRLSVLLGSQKEANELFKDTADFASGVSFQYEELMNTATSLAGVMEGGRKEVSKWMPVLADLAAASGLTMEETTSNFIRMYSSGAAAADAFRDKGILAMLGFQAKTQYTAEQTRKMLIQAWEDPASKFRDASLKLANTWSGLLSMMADRWFQFRVQVMESGLMDYLKAIVKVYLEWTDKLKKEGRIDDWARQVADGVINAFESVLLGAASFYDAVQPIVHAMKVVISSIIDVWKDLPDWVQDVGIILAVFGGKKVAIAIAGLTHLYNAVKNMAKGAGLVAGGALKLSDFAKMNFEELDAFIKEFDEKYPEVVKEATDAAGKAGEKQVTGLRAQIEAFLAQVRATRDKLKAEREAEDKKGGGPRPPKEKVDTKLIDARLKAEAKRELELNKTKLAELNAQYENQQGKFREYFEERLKLLEAEHTIKMDLLKAEIAAEEDPSKKVTMEAQLYALEQEHARNKLALQLELNKAQEDEVEARKSAAEVIQDINNRLMQSEAAGGGLAEKFAMEQEQLRQQQEEDINALLELKKQGYDIEEEMADAHHKHMLENEQLAANQRKELWQTYVDSLHGTLSGLTSMFNQWYQAAGEKHKELFNLYKAASIAETIIATYSAAQKAYDSMAKVPYVGQALAVAAAAAAIAAGLARVNLIRQQQMAAGGLVAGRSPHPRADNIDIKATAGEYMQPVSTVQHYGVRAMEAIRKKLVPREILMAFAAKIPVPSINIPRLEYATGGAVATAAGAGTGAGTNLSMPVSISLPEQLSFIGRRLEAEVEPVILRVLQEELKY